MGHGRLNPIALIKHRIFGRHNANCSNSQPDPKLKEVAAADRPSSLTGPTLVTAPNGAANRKCCISKRFNSCVEKQAPLLKQPNARNAANRW
jgi:hypothetical protein